jgi:hypothetical protein
MKISQIFKNKGICIDYYQRMGRGFQNIRNFKFLEKNPEKKKRQEKNLEKLLLIVLNYIKVN